MSTWTLADLRRLDRIYAEDGVHIHQRPFRAAMELLGSAFTIGVISNPEVRRITDAYAAMVPEVRTTWPGAGIGFVASVDQVRKIVLPVVFGESALHPWEMAGFTSAIEFELWCRQDAGIAAQVALATADLYDFTMGLNEIGHGCPGALTLWRMARSNLEDVANVLPASFSHDSVVQPICLVAELSLKALLVWDRASPNSFKGRDGHDLESLARQVALAHRHRDDVRIEQVVASLPSYVGSRYQPSMLTRLRVVQLALGVQFLAASTLRRLASSDVAAQMETNTWPGPRAALDL